MDNDARYGAGMWTGLVRGFGVIAFYVTFLCASPALATYPCGRGGVLSATANAPGATLIAWEELCVTPAPEAGGLLSYQNTRVSIGSVNQGFTDLGAITPPTALASPTGVVLDDAGNAWVSGIDSVFGGYQGGNKEGYPSAYYVPHGGWVAFRPAGGSFAAPNALLGGGKVTAVQHRWQPRR